MAEATIRPELAALIQRGEEAGCIELSEFDELVQSLELPDDEVEAIQSQIEAQGLELSDDCGRQAVEPARYENGDLPSMTTRAVRVFLNETGRPPVLPK